MGTAADLEVVLDGLFLENTTYDYNDYVNKDDGPDSRVLSVFVPLLYSLTLISGLLGNGLVLAVLCQLRRAWSVADTFVLLLSSANALLLFTLPFWAAEAAQGWSFGTPVCSLMGAIFKTSFCCGAVLLACMGVECSLFIARDVEMFSKWKPRQVQASFLLVWLFCLLLCIPDWIALKHWELGMSGVVKCSFNFPQPSTAAHASRWLYHIVGFVTPFIIIVFCFSYILVQLSHSPKKLQKQTAVRLILMLLLAFLVCWTPFNLTLIGDTVNFHLGNTLTLDRPLLMIIVLGCLQSSVNPVLYICVCANFRRHLLHMLCLCHEKPPNQNLPLWENSKNESEENGQMCLQKTVHETCS
ncbi:C-X-C chemokine receptor type 3-like [Arapaima gigas]